MLDADRSLCIVGCGTMGEAIVGGLLRAGWIEPRQICATTRRPEPAERLQERLGISAGTDNVSAMRDAQVIILCLKPQRFAKVLEQAEVAAALEGKLVISIAAGITLEQLATWLPQSKVVRAMPNTPALIAAGMTVLSRAPEVGDEELALARRIFESVGSVLELENKHMDAVTSLNGSGPAFAYVMLEAMADGGVMMGLPREAALTIASHVFSGAAAMVSETDLHPAALKDQVTTPAGCTIAGLLMMEDGRIRSVIARTIQEAARVAGGLGDAK
jgi:pyrroline-5-carboxylate reductase